MSMPHATTGIEGIDRLIGGVLPGDNIVWGVDSGAPVIRLVSAFLAACEQQKCPVNYVSFNLSPYTIASNLRGLMSPERLTLIDGFSSGRGRDDQVFVRFFEEAADETHAQIPFKAVRLSAPTDPEAVRGELARLENARGMYVFDSLTAMLNLWGDEESVLQFFGHMCPRLYSLNTIAYWLFETEAHTEKFRAKVRHITQIVLEVAVAQGRRTITVRKASARPSVDFGIPQPFEVENDKIVMTAESREDRELSLLTKIGEALGDALDPNVFFEQVMAALADELGLLRGALVLLDRIKNALCIAAAHGLTPSERERGHYALGEGITGRVAETGVAEVVPDISTDRRFLDRTAAQRDSTLKVSFICVPLKIDGKVVGVLSVDRASASATTLNKDLRLLSIVASILSQVLKINRMIQVEREEILSRDKAILNDLRTRYKLNSVVGRSVEIQRVLAAAATAAKSCASILVTGDTGTGKELVASVVHYNSPRAHQSFVKVNCGALSETLLESELFGHVKGAFTGADRNRKGRFELAHRGTLFLDEIAEMSPRLQVKVLRVLQEGELEPVGSERATKVDVRVVAATNKDMRTEVKLGRFREDLYYRLNVIPIHLPPLRYRRDDIPLLVDHFLEIYCKKNQKHIAKLSRQVLDLLVSHDWPGNVRELENTIERAVVMSPGDTLTTDLLPEEIVHRTPDRARKRPKPSDFAEAQAAAEVFLDGASEVAEAMRQLLSAVEASSIRKAMKQGGTQEELAARLGMSRMTLRKRMRALGIRKE